MGPPEQRRLRSLELVGCALILLAAAFPRFRDLRIPFDRAVDGFQGSCFALFAVNYERIGIGRYGGYPVFNIDLPADEDTPLYVYPNHPPTVPLLGWASLKLFGPDGWDQAWRDQRAPQGIEGALRLPFLLFHMLGLWALWWAMRQNDGTQRALLALALAATAPIAILCAGLVNYENACIPLLLVALGFHARWLASDGRRDLVLCATFALLASAVTFTPIFFLPALVLQTLIARGWRRAATEALVVGAAALLPLFLHGLWVRASVPIAAESVWTRGTALLTPMFDGSAPLSEWLRRQALRLSYFFTPWIAVLAGTGVLVGLFRALRKGSEAARPTPSVVFPLALGALLSQLGLYQHTFDGAQAETGQTNFLLNLAPAVAALAALTLDAVARPLWRLRGGFAPLVLLVGLVVLPALVHTGQIRDAWRAPGPEDDPPGTDGPDVPLPSTTATRIAEILPPGSAGLIPAGIALGPAVSFYSWRTVLGVDEATWAVRMGTIEETLGLGPDAARYLLFPRHPPASAKAIIDRYRPGLVTKFGEPVAVTEHWELWPPEP